MEAFGGGFGIEPVNPDGRSLGGLGAGKIADDLLPDGPCAAGFLESVRINMRIQQVEPRELFAITILQMFGDESVDGL